MSYPEARRIQELLKTWKQRIPRYQQIYKLSVRELLELADSEDHRAEWILDRPKIGFWERILQSERANSARRRALVYRCYALTGHYEHPNRRKYKYYYDYDEYLQNVIDRLYI